MEIRHGQQFGLAVGQPLFGGGGLALWAMPVAARVVRDAQVGAVFAAFDMTAQRRRSAAFDRRHDLELAEAHMAGMRRTPSRPAMAEELRHLDRRPTQRPRVSRASSAESRAAWSPARSC